jgi:tRNA (guanosine-2'-O-)-methyltransferase
MRRRSPGNLLRDELLPERIARVESLDPARVVRELEPLVTEQRRERLKQVIARRIGSVRVVFDDPYDPHNGAAVIRTCEAFGVQRLGILERTRPFLASSTVARGAHKWIDVSTFQKVETLAAWLSSAEEPARESAWTVALAAPDGELVPADLARIPKLALIVGNERSGVGPELGKICNASVRVPMRGFVESLNVSVTTAILVAAATEGRAGDLSAADQLRLYARGLYFSVQHADDVLTIGREPR